MIEMLFPVVGGALAAVGLTSLLRRYLRNEMRWDYRRQAHLLILFLPVFITGLICWHLLEDGYLDGIHGWLEPSAPLFNSAPLWFLFFTAVLAVAGSAGYTLRHWYLAWHLRGCSRVDDSVARVQVSVDELALRAKTVPPSVRRLLTQKPLAVVTGFRHPVLYLSSWYFEQLSEAELVPVLAHELAHIARRDNLMAVWASGWLLGCFYWPASWQAFDQLMQERELAADELAVSLTDKPLRLARVLIKASEAHRTDALAACQFEAEGATERRVERLIYLHQVRPLAGQGIPPWQIVAVWLMVAFTAILAADLIPHWLDTLP